MKSRRNLSKVLVRVEDPGPNGNTNTVWRAAILLLVLIALGLAAPSRGYAATLTVCASGCKYTTIATAIAAARPSSTISILDAVHTERNITVDRNLTIQGRGAANTAVDGGAAGINGTVFLVGSGVTAIFQNLTIRNGVDFYSSGGGIFNEGTLTIRNAAFSGNLTGSAGGAIFTLGTLTVTNSTFFDNTALGGGGIDNEGTLTVTNSTFSHNGNDTFFGGGIASNGTLTVSNCTFDTNGAGKGGGGIFSEGTLTVNNSTFSNNGGSDGGGILNFDTPSVATVTNSTFSDNDALGGAGIASDGTLTVTNCTFADNISYGGGGISDSGALAISNSTFYGNSAQTVGADIIFSGTSAVLKSTILAGSSSGGNCFGTLTDGKYNISDDATCGFTASGSRNSTNPLVDPAGLRNNGGSTATIALDSESPAIDAIPLADCTDQNSDPIHTDQRGALRPDPGEVDCDIGAYEFQDFAGQTNCPKKSDSALVQQYESLSAAASAYGFSTVKALEAAVQRSCERTPAAICPPPGKGTEAPCVVPHG